MTFLRAHFDGRVLIPDEPANLPVGRALQLQISEAVPELPVLLPPKANPTTPEDIRRAFEDESLLRDTPQTPLMQQRVSLITLGVASVAKARAFYERLGWRASPPSNEDAAFFQAGGMIVSLYQKDALAADSGIPVTPPGSMALAHNLPSKTDVDALLLAAQNAGGTLLKPAEDKFWGGYSGYFADMDGHPWEIAWNPGFELGSDGTIHLPKED